MGVAVGVVGVGRIGAAHARALAASGLVERLVVADADASRAERVAREVGARWAATPEDVVRAGVGALVVTAATTAHAPLIRLGARAGIPVFCEKPIALDLSLTDAVLEDVDRAGTPLQIGFQRRFDPAFQAARHAVRSGRLGELRLVRACTHDPEPPPEAYVGTSGGLWRDLMIHDFDIVAWIAGEPIVEVYADGCAREELFARHDDVDTAAAVVRFAGGTLGILSGSRRNARGYDVRLELLGTGDTVSVAVGAGARDFMDRFEGAYRAELDAFLRLVVDGGTSPCTGSEARQALRIALAAERSRREHRPVAVTEVS